MVLFHRRTPLTLAGALLLSSLILVQPLPAQEQSPGQHRAWKVKESATRLWIENGMLVSATGQGIAEPIPLSNIKVLTYETISEHPAAGMIEAWIVDWLDVASGGGEGAWVVIYPMAAGTAILSPFLPIKSTRHLVHIEWAQDFENEERVFLLSKADARSLLNELQKVTGIHWSNANHIGSLQRSALEPSSAKREDSLGRLPRGRLVFVDRGYGTSVEIVPLPPAPSDCTSLSSDYEMAIEEARRQLEEAVRKEESRQSVAPPKSSKPTLRLDTSQQRSKSILREIKPCRRPADDRWPGAARSG